MDFGQIEQTDYLELLNAADELAFDRIVETFQEYLINYQQEYLKKDPIGILQAFSHKQFIPLRDFCIEMICQEILSENERFLNTEENSNVKINIGVKPNVKEIHAHSFILQVHCPFFRNALTNATKTNGYYIFEKPNISELIFRPILK